MKEKLRAQRQREFRRRAVHDPDNLYRHREHHWEYIPVHPFGDELELLNRLRLQPSDCQSADAWWFVDGDATLLQAWTAPGPAPEVIMRAFPTTHVERWTYLQVVLPCPFVTRTVFERAMTAFVAAGFPRAPQFQLKMNDEALELTSTMIL